MTLINETTRVPVTLPATINGITIVDWEPPFDAYGAEAHVVTEKSIYPASKFGLTVRENS